MRASVCVCGSVWAEGGEEGGECELKRQAREIEDMKKRPGGLGVRACLREGGVAWTCANKVQGACHGQRIMKERAESGASRAELSPLTPLHRTGARH